MSSEQRAQALVEKALRTQFGVLVDAAKKASANSDEYQRATSVMIECHQEFVAEAKRAQAAKDYSQAHLDKLKEIKARSDKAERLSKKNYSEIHQKEWDAWQDVTDYTQLLERMMWTSCRFSDSFIAEMREIKKANPFSEEKLRALIRKS